MQAILDSLKHELASRKFRWLLAGELGVVAAYLNGELTMEKALAAGIVLIVSYMGTVSYEDGQAKRGGA